MHAWALFSNNQEIMLRTGALPLKYALTATRFFTRMGYQPAKKISLKAGAVINYPVKKLEFAPVEKRKNIILVLVDSFRADMLNPEVMPKLWDFSQKYPSVRFTKHFSGGNCTKTGVFSLFYGISGNYFDQAMRSGVGAAMIDSMLKLGYDVKIFSSSNLTSPPFNRTIFVNVPDLEVRQKGSSKIERDKISIDACLAYLEKKESDKPCFILLFLDSVHGNAVPDGFPCKFGTPMKKMNFLTLQNDETTKRNAFNLMRNACNYMDTVLDDFFARAKMSERIQKDTVLLFTSDHGNEFSESDMQNWGHNSNFSRYQTHSPLLIFGLDRPAQTVNYQTSAMDISATIMKDLLGCTNAVSDYSMGRNLFDPTEREFIVLTSYLETGILYEGNIFVQTVYGVSLAYDLDGRFIESHWPAPVVRKFFDINKQYAK